MEQRPEGLTLIELMVTLAVAIVVLAIGIPAFNTLTARDMAAAAVNGLVTALQQARVEAIGANMPVNVCALTCAKSPVPDCANSATDWGCGWVVIRPSDASEVRRFAAPRPEISVSVVGVVPPQFNTKGEASAASTSTFAVRAYRKAGLPRVPTDCVRLTEVLVTAVGQVRSEVKSCP